MTIRPAPTPAEPGADAPSPSGEARDSLPDWRDLALTAAVLLATLSSAGLASRPAGEPRLTWPAALVAAATALPLAWRRRFPLGVWLVASALAAFYGIVDWPDPLAPFGALVALATVFERCPTPQKMAAGAISAVGIFAAVAAAGDSDALDWWTAVLVITLAPVLGEYLRARRGLELQLRARAEQVERTRSRALEDAQLAERSRMARELHDILAHHVTMFVVSAEAAASVAHMTDAERQSAFDGLAAAGRSALAEIRGLLGVLRRDGPAPTAPQPGLDHVPDLLASLARAGVAVRYASHGEPNALPALTDLAAYRVVEEGLTNAVRHGAGGRAELTIDHQPGRLCIELVNDIARVGGAERPHAGELAPAGGLGLVGLRERVMLAGGTLRAGPVPGLPDRFRLAVELPTGEGEAP